MIVLDTNVVSELARAAPAPSVTAWYDAQFDDLMITSITLAELSYGIARLPAGRRRAELGDALARVTTAHFSDRILPFDAAAATEYGLLLAARARSGRRAAALDVQIAAIASVHGATVATRDTADFDHPGLPLVDPWRG